MVPIRRTFWVRSPGGIVSYTVRDTNGTPLVGPVAVGANDGWELITDTFNSGAHTRFTVEFADSGTGVSYLDAVEVRRAVVEPDPFGIPPTII